MGPWFWTGRLDLDSILITTLFFRLNPQRPGDLKEAYNTCVLSPMTVCVCVCVMLSFQCVVLLQVLVLSHPAGAALWCPA